MEESPVPVSARWLTLGTVAMGALACGLRVGAAPDPWTRLARGRAILEGAPVSFPDPRWGADLSLAAWASLAGEPTLVYLHWMVLIGATLFLSLAFERRTASPMAAGIGGLAATVVATSVLEPGTGTVTLLGLSIVLLLGPAGGRALPVLLGVWANLEPGHLVGLALLVWLSPPRCRQAAWLSAIACLVNPAGPVNFVTSALELARSPSSALVPLLAVGSGWSLSRWGASLLRRFPLDRVPPLWIAGAGLLAATHVLAPFPLSSRAHHYLVREYEKPVGVVDAARRAGISGSVRTPPRWEGFVAWRTQGRLRRLDPEVEDLDYFLLWPREDAAVLDPLISDGWRVLGQDAIGTLLVPPGETTSVMEVMMASPWSEQAAAVANLREGRPFEAVAALELAMRSDPCDRVTITLLQEAYRASAQPVRAAQLGARSRGCFPVEAEKAPGLFSAAENRPGAFPAEAP